jgi:hypothetical protein
MNSPLVRRILLACAALVLLGGSVTAIALTSDASSAQPNTAGVVAVPTGAAGAGVAGVQAVAKAPASGFALSVVNDNAQVPAGSATAFTVAIFRTNFAGTIAFTASGAPAGATLTFTPQSTTGNSVSLAISTPAGTTLGSYSVTIAGSSGSTHASTVAHLTVSAGNAGNGGNPGHAFTLTGTLDRQLAPGVTGYLDLALANPNNQTMRVTALSVTITGIGAPGCGPANFTTAPFSGGPVSVPANTTRTLSQLNVPKSEWPSVTMVDLPSNQDACKGTSLSLAYTGTGQGN